jgi:hypothetical protein
VLAHLLLAPLDDTAHAVFNLLVSESPILKQAPNGTRGLARRYKFNGHGHGNASATGSASPKTPSNQARRRRIQSPLIGPVGAGEPSARPPSRPCAPRGASGPDP